jgi:hypothetical protein
VVKSGGAGGSTGVQLPTQLIRVQLCYDDVYVSGDDTYIRLDRITARIRYELLFLLISPPVRCVFGFFFAKAAWPEG